MYLCIRFWSAKGMPRFIMYTMGPWIFKSLGFRHEYLKKSCLLYCGPAPSVLLSQLSLTKLFNPSWNLPLFCFSQLSSIVSSPTSLGGPSASWLGHLLCSAVGVPQGFIWSPFHPLYLFSRWSHLLVPPQLPSLCQWLTNLPLLNYLLPFDPASRSNKCSLEVLQQTKIEHDQNWNHLSCISFPHFSIIGDTNTLSVVFDCVPSRPLSSSPCSDIDIFLLHNISKSSLFFLYTLLKLSSRSSLFPVLTSAVS